MASSISTVRPAERKIFFDILPSRNYQVFALLKDQVKQYKKENAVVFIKGNHDQFYFNLRKGMTLMKNKMVSLC